ncbi:uncharacterized protein LOC104883796 [Beta vulgaris subsp. vulgaris]|uniref:uncharacterized protein LOC104883796 n=1 Tax=Beta vulgaris subsp. vulgaris TaxID=3555 RepID=UPI00053F94F3|nr:uncharacterized protein LOC104883796 [Beta vulgaris subsp. vulgaris]
MDKIIIWNVRGVNNPNKQLEVKKFLTKKVVGIVGLLETKVKASNMGSLYQKLFSGWCFTANLAEHRSGRIVLAWNPNSFLVNIIFMSSQVIHCCVSPMGGTWSFFLSVIYAFNDAASRKIVWKDLEEISLKIKGPWLMGGDFNCVLNPEERIGAVVRQHEIANLQRCMSVCGMRDLMSSGCMYTWNNKQQEESRVFCKLDRAMVNESWLDVYPSAMAHFMPEGIFDHTPIVINVYPSIEPGKQPFIYYTMWSRDEKFERIVAECWATQVSGSKMYQVTSRLKKIKQGLKKLNAEGFSDLQASDIRALRSLMQCQERLQAQPMNMEYRRAEREAGIQYNLVHKQYLSFLAQKSKMRWCKDGDENTKLFHQSIRARRLQNTVYAIHDDQGNWMENVEEVNTAFLNYYKKLLGSELLNRIPVKESVINKGPVLSVEHKEFLNRQYTTEEVKCALFSIPGDKAPGPDGFGGYFFRDAWTIIGEDVTATVLAFFNSGKLLKEVNATTLTLIPKIPCPSSVKEFRPIACCNVLYKCITKMLCNRLRVVSPELIAENQGEFVHERFIVHNIMVCQDLVRHYGRKNVKPSCIMKLDMQKAYDTIDWQFLNEMMVALQFPSHFIHLVMTCVRTPRFSLMLNGSLHGFFESKRGLRQGDPISPLLFVICMEYMSRIMKSLDTMPAFRYHPRCKGIKLSHLVFADDVILCCGGDFPSVYVMLQAFQLFSDSSGLQINNQKSEFYTAGINESLILRIRNASGFRHSELPFKYLGVPICAKRISTAECGVLVEKMSARIKIWSSRHLSYTGRLQLVNSVLMSIHVYWAQVFIIPRCVLQDIERVCRAYLWTGCYHTARGGNVAWDKVCQPKQARGLGIRQVMQWNKAAMTKYVWAIASKQDSLWIKWLNNVYIKGADWWTYQAPQNSSWYWKQICKVKEEIQRVYR